MAIGFIVSWPFGQSFPFIARLNRSPSEIRSQGRHEVPPPPAVSILEFKIQMGFAATVRLMGFSRVGHAGE
jgi:hypothetical protein